MAYICIKTDETDDCSIMIQGHANDFACMFGALFAEDPDMAQYAFDGLLLLTKEGIDKIKKDEGKRIDKTENFSVEKNAQKELSILRKQNSWMKELLDNIVENSSDEELRSKAEIILRNCEDTEEQRKQTAERLAKHKKNEE